MVRCESITPIILAGGSGTRLWPMSRQSYPKQFVNLFGVNTLFQDSALRTCSSEILDFSPPIVIGHSDYRFIMSDQLESVEVKPSAIVLEPSPKNTAPAVLAASLLALREDEESILLVCPSDHLITDTLNFHRTIESGLVAVNSGKLVTFGVRPSTPATSYGYIEVENMLGSDAVDVTRFVEKPKREDAVKMISEGRHFWNSGIFMFKARDVVSAFRKLCPEILEHTAEAVNLAEMDLNFLRLNEKPWEKCSNISIDYAIMERSKNISVVEFGTTWTDLGSWEAVWEYHEKDLNGVALSEGAMYLDCKNTLLKADGGQTLVGIGLENIVVVATSDAILVTHIDKTQDVKIAVEKLKESKTPEAIKSPKDYRPWGWFETLELENRYQVKRITVHPGAALSLQSHYHRSEHWIVVRGAANVTINNKVSILAEGQSVYIPLGATHRLENPGKINLELIEVQTGSYLGEDDIVRLDDKYSRA